MVKTPHCIVLARVTDMDQLGAELRLLPCFGYVDLGPGAEVEVKAPLADGGRGSPAAGKNDADGYGTSFRARVVWRDDRSFRVAFHLARAADTDEDTPFPL